MKILLADDHAMFREGVAHILHELEDAVTVVEAGNVDQALQAIEDHDDLDLVVIDLFMPGRNGFDALEFLSRQQPTLPIVVLSASDHPQDMHNAIRLGAMGFIRKDSSGGVLLNALRLVLSGEIYIPAQMLRETPPEVHLTQRQKDVLLLMEQGHPNKIIAGHLNISEPTVKMHISAIFRALSVTNRTQAVLKAREMGILRES